MQTLEPVLAGIPLFQGLKPAHLALVAGCASNVRLAAGEYVGHAGEPADQFWIVREGRVALEIHAPGRGSVTIHSIGAEEVLGWSWLLPPHQLHFDLRALGPVRALMFDGRCLRGKFAEDYELAYELTKRFMRIIVERLEATGLQLLDLYGDDR